MDYIVIEKLLGHWLPGTGDLYIHDWDSRLRDAVARLAVLIEKKLREEIAGKKAGKSLRGATKSAAILHRTNSELCKWWKNGAEGQN